MYALYQMVAPSTIERTELRTDKITGEYYDHVIDRWCLEKLPTPKEEAYEEKSFDSVKDAFDFVKKHKDFYSGYHPKTITAIPILKI